MPPHSKQKDHFLFWTAYQMTEWPHSPPHRLFEAGAFMVTAGTYQKAHYINTAEKLSFVQTTLLDLAEEFRWRIQAWSILINHYHFVALSPDDPSNLKQFISKLHMITAKHINQLDNTPGRRVWYQYWESKITFEKSYYARLHYVHKNPVKHGVVDNASNYLWCSAAWFENSAPSVFQKMVYGFKIDSVNVMDDF